MTKKTDKPDKKDQQITELTADLQRIRADFENYRKRVELEKKQAEERGERRSVIKLLPVVDTIERAIIHIPKDLADHKWVKGVEGVIKQLDTALTNIGVSRIDAKKGADFNPELHQAVQMDEEATGDSEIIAEELQAGYKMGDSVMRHAMVKVTRK